jgi:hypothetical protein
MILNFCFRINVSGIKSKLSLKCCGMVFLDFLNSEEKDYYFLIAISFAGEREGVNDFILYS